MNLPNYIPKFHVANIESLISKNAQRRKIPFLREVCALDKPYFLAFAESHLNKEIKEAEFNIPEYTYCASHRDRRKGGGVIIYINNSFTYQTLVSASDMMCSFVAVFINELNLIVSMIYRPPPDYSTQYHGELLEKSFKAIVIDNIDKIMSDYKSPVPDIIITGDFNFPKAVWKNGIGEAIATNRSEKISLQQMIDLASKFNLLQKVSFGTRKARSGNSNTLELIFTNNHELISNIYSEHSEITDHDYIICETSHNFTIDESQPTEAKETNLSSYNYEKADWDTVKAKLRDVNWEDILNRYENSDEKVNAFLEIVSKIVDDHCIKFKQKRGSAKKNIPRDRRILLRNKKNLKSKLKKNLSSNKKDQVLNSIIDIDKKLLTSHQTERHNKEMLAIKNIKSNPKHFFSYAKKQLKTKSSIGPFRIDNNLITEHGKISESLSEQYSSSFSSPDPHQNIGNPLEFFEVVEDQSTNTNLLTNIIFTREMIIKEIGNIKRDSAPGPDHFPVRLLQECAEELSEPLFLLWRYSLDTGDIASLHKNAVICPILKPNSQRCHPKSYRPISLIS